MAGTAVGRGAYTAAGTSRINYLRKNAISDRILDHMSISVTRKDTKEANENIIRRFNRRVLQSGVIAEAKANERFEKPISKTERRKKAIIRKARNEEKIKAIRLGK